MLYDKPDSMIPSLNRSPQVRAGSLKAPFIAILFLTALFTSGCVIHDDGYRYSRHAGPVAAQPRVAVSAPAPVVFTFTDTHRHRAQKYYHAHPRHHGKKHKWKKKWRHKRKSRLHADIRIQPVPIDLVRQFPPAPRGTRYIYDDDQVLLVDVNTRVVLDFINISMSVGTPVAIAAPAPVTFAFTDHHRHTVRNYYHKHPHHGKKHKKKKKKKWKNKGRGKGHGRGQLPPGLRKRDVLPPGIQMQTVPNDLVRQLPPPPRGTRYTYNDDQVLLIDLNTRIVLDFINISVSVGF
jgi:Ni/Co efflux regulator RcnB